MPNIKPQQKTIQLTPEGLEELKAELEELTQVKQPAIIKRLAAAREQGDLSENADYQNAKEEQQLIEARITDIEEVISKATIVKKTRSHTTVGMGSTVVAELKGKKSKTFTYTIVGEFQANPQEGKVSSDSPLGRALMGANKGDEVTVKAPAGDVSYIVLEVK